MRFVVKDEGCVLCEIKDGQGVRGFRSSGRRSDDHWSPLGKQIIRKNREIRDFINWSRGAIIYSCSVRFVF